MLLLRVSQLWLCLQLAGGSAQWVGADWRWQLDNLPCLLPLTSSEAQISRTAAQLRALDRVSTLPSSATPPTFVIGALPTAASYLLAGMAATLVSGFAGYTRVNVTTVGFSTALPALAAGTVHLLLDTRPVSMLGDADAAAAWLANASLVAPLGTLGASARAGLWASASLLARFHAVGAPLASQPWATTVATLTSQGSNLAAAAATLAPALAAVGATVLVPRDATGALPAGLLGTTCSRVCIPKASVTGLTVVASTPDYVFYPFYANFSAVVACKFVTGGELGLRMAMEAQVAAQGGRTDLLVVLPADPSPAVLDARYGMRRIGLAPFTTASFAAGFGDWPAEPLLKVAAASVRTTFPRAVWQAMQVRGCLRAG